MKKSKYKDVDDFWEVLNTEKVIRDARVKRYYEDALRGTKFPMPYLVYGKGGMNQEGHHRVEVAKMLGIPSIPVFVINERDSSLSVSDYETEKKVVDYLQSIGIVGMAKLLRYYLRPDDFIIERNVEKWWQDELVRIYESSTSFNSFFNKENIFKAIDIAEKLDTTIKADLSKHLKESGLSVDSMTTDQWRSIMGEFELVGDFLRLFGNDPTNYMKVQGIIDDSGYPTSKGINKDFSYRLFKYSDVLAEEAYKMLYRRYLEGNKHTSELFLKIIELSNK
jgi:hypothetical protein